MDYGVCSYPFSYYSTFRPEEFLVRRFDSPPRTHSSLFHYDELSLINIVRYFYTCTVLKLAIMIFVHFPSDLTKLLPNYVFLDCIKISEKKIYNSNRQVTWIIRFYLLT